MSTSETLKGQFLSGLVEDLHPHSGRFCLGLESGFLFTYYGSIFQNECHEKEHMETILSHSLIGKPLQQNKIYVGIS